MSEPDTEELAEWLDSRVWRLDGAEGVLVGDAEARNIKKISCEIRFCLCMSKHKQFVI